MQDIDTKPLLECAHLWYDNIAFAVWGRWYLYELLEFQIHSVSFILSENGKYPAIFFQALFCKADSHGAIGSIKFLSNSMVYKFIALVPFKLSTMAQNILMI